MFSLKKEDIKTTSEQWAEEGRLAVDHAANQVKASANSVAQKVAEKSDDFKGEANHLITTLKNVIQEYIDAAKVERIQEQISGKASAIKTAVTDEISNVYHAGRDKAEFAVKDNPVTTLAIVAGAGILIGYLLGTKQSSK